MGQILSDFGALKGLKKEMEKKEQSASPKPAVEKNKSRTVQHRTLEEEHARNIGIEKGAKVRMMDSSDTGTTVVTVKSSQGGIGYLWNRPVAFVFIRPERYNHDFIESNERLTLSFYPEQYRKALQICGTKSGRDIDKAKETGLTPLELEGGEMTFEQARLTIVGRKLFEAPMQEAEIIDKSILDQWYGGSHGGLHDVYAVEIESVWEQ